MNSAPKIVIISSETAMQAEFEDALASLSNLSPIIHMARSHREGIEIARSRQPDIIIIEIDNNLEVFKIFAEEIKIVAPNAIIIAVFNSNIFNTEESESNFIIDAFRAGASDFLRRPISRSDLEFVLMHIFRRKTDIKTQQLGKIITFFTNKGGVGKSTISTSVACILARKYPGKILLLDASLQFGICSGLLDLKPVTTLADAAKQFSRLDETLLQELTTPHDSGLYLLAAPFNALEAASIDDDIISRVLTLARRVYEIIIIDTFPMIDRVMMGILDLTDKTYLITESLVPVLHGTRQLLNILDELGYKKDNRRIILNKYSNSLGHLKPQIIIDEMKFKIDYIVPYEKKLTVAANLGEPFVLRNNWLTSKFTKTIKHIADDIEESF
jgi:pilus assembly protein CpaE